MHLVYYDESGDDGFIKFSAPIFVLTGIYIYKDNWRQTYQEIYSFRKTIRNTYGFLLKAELHTKFFLMNKGGYRNLNICTDDRMAIIEEFCKLISKLPIKCINVVINKKEVKKRPFDVLDAAMDWSINRIENDIRYNHSSSCKYLLISDEGRLSKMRRTARRIQQYNPIKLCYSGQSQNRRIERVIEDILPKNSQESFFIQIADLIAFIVYVYSLVKYDLAPISRQLPRTLTYEKLQEWLEIINPILNLEANKRASFRDKYGIVYYPDIKPQ